jgi:hypothetical protein
MAVVLKNKRRRMLPFNLEAPFFVKRTDVTRLGQPEVITFMPLEKKEDLPDAILGCAEIHSAIEKGVLRNMTPPPAAPKEEKPKAAQPAAAEKTTRRKAGKGEVE